MGKVLALDYGKRFLGVAVSDEGKLMAFGRGFLDRKKGLSFILKQLMSLCQQEGVEKIVMGLPFDPHGEDTEQTRQIRIFSRKVSDFLNIPIVFQDESFSSFQAGRILAEHHVKGKDHKKNEDELAAILILEKYLNS
jgi:putative Holliday junction resolvase